MWIRVAMLLAAAGLALGLALPGSAQASSSPARSAACAGTPGSGAGEHALPVKMKERQHSPRAVPGAPPGCGHGSPGLASVK
jgi:hypothetical protein